MVFKFIGKAIIGVSIDRLAQAAASQEAFDGGKATAFSTSDVVEGYFQKYGSTARKFDYHPKPGFFIGYVILPSIGEILSVVIMQAGGSTVASFEPESSHSEDVLGLMGKKAFADEVAASIMKSSR